MPDPQRTQTVGALMAEILHGEGVYSDALADLILGAAALGFSLSPGGPLDDVTLAELAILVQPAGEC